jgi:hypothetical protein
MIAMLDGSNGCRQSFIITTLFVVQGIIIKLKFMSTGGAANQADNTTYPASQVMWYMLWVIAQQIIKRIKLKIVGRNDIQSVNKLRYS